MIFRHFILCVQKYRISRCCPLGIGKFYVIGIGKIYHTLYSIAVQASFFCDMVERLPLHQRVPALIPRA